MTAYSWWCNTTMTFSLLAQMVQSHNRLECPPPRSGNTGAKSGPCDAADPGAAVLPAFALTANAINTVTWLEALSHPGAPARFALSLDGNSDDNDDGFESCILLDHIPHDEYSFPEAIFDAVRSHRQSLSLYIPDIYCERCTLQLVTYMTDEAHGVNAGESCVSPGAKAAGTVAADADLLLPACGVVYHSCAPVSINGTQPRNEITQCNTADFEAELDWPFMNMNEQGEMMTTGQRRDYSTYLYKGNPGLYNQSNSRLLSAGAAIENCGNFVYCDPAEHYQEIFAVPQDAKYASLQGTCAPIVNMEVEDFVLGKLPSVLKTNTKEPPTGDPFSWFGIVGTASAFLGWLLPCFF